MRHIDFTPLFRSTIGFDHLTRLMDQAAGFDSENGYPPYNIERLAEHDYRITMAVAGFTEDELKLELKDTVLTVKGDKKADSNGHDYLHRGIAARSFERRFQLADFVEVKGASLKDGLLSIDLVRNLPERMKPRTIAITAGEAPKTLESKAA
jgi:molecular chaperone IbpA